MNTNEWTPEDIQAMEEIRAQFLRVFADIRNTFEKAEQEA